MRVLNKDTTLLLTTHDMEEVESLVDQCCIMNMGTVLTVGSVSALRHECDIAFELTLRESREVVSKVASQLNVRKVRYNEMCNVWTI